MSVRNLIPGARRDLASTSSENVVHPVMSLQREMNRLFDDMFRGFETGFPAGLGTRGFGGAWPRLEVRDDEDAVRVSAELPGMEEKDVELLLEDGVLTMRGETSSHNEDAKSRFSERHYGRFERRIQLGYEIDEDKVKADLKNGVLEIVLPKDKNASSRVKRIPLGG